MGCCESSSHRYRPVQLYSSETSSGKKKTVKKHKPPVKRKQKTTRVLKTKPALVSSEPMPLLPEASAAPTVPVSESTTPIHETSSVVLHDVFIVLPLTYRPADFGFGDRHEGTVGQALLSSSQWQHVDESIWLWCQLRRIIVWEKYIVLRMAMGQEDFEFIQKYRDNPLIDAGAWKRVQTRRGFWDALVKDSRDQPDRNPINQNEYAAAWKSPLFANDPDREPTFVPEWLIQKFEHTAAECKSPVPLLPATMRDTYQDVFDRDRVLHESHVIVALYGGEYAGHVYTWKPANDKESLCMQGIRATIWNSFVNCDAAHPRSKASVARALIEGVRQQTIRLKRKHIVVVIPIGVMPILLRKLGFQPKPPFGDHSSMSFWIEVDKLAVHPTQSVRFVTK